jgi:peptide/nickel transport system ATP-binding protein
LGGLLSGKEIIAVNEVSFALSAEEPTIFSIIGESGSGKTTLSRMILHLLAPDGGTVELAGKNVNDYKGAKRQIDYMRLVQPIFQNPFETFNPLSRVDSYLHETARNFYPREGEADRKARVEKALRDVGLSLEEVGGRYPHELSGGQLQRASIARAIIPTPKVLVADEPVSMVDASLRMSIVNLFQELKTKLGTSIVYITHDLATAYYISDKIAIIHKGFFVEQGDTVPILSNPKHPYTRLLVESTLDPRPGSAALDKCAISHGGEEYLSTGCKFAGRCPNATERCRDAAPGEISDGAWKVRCFLYETSAKEIL